MIFDMHVGLGAVIEIILLAAGLVGGWATMKVMQKVMSEKLKELKTETDEDRKLNAERHTQNVGQIGELKVKIAEDCLKKDDFRDFERRFDEKIGKIEHSVGNAASKTVGQILDMLQVAGVVSGRARNLQPGGDR